MRGRTGPVFRLRGTTAPAVAGAVVLALGITGCTAPHVYTGEDAAVVARALTELTVVDRRVHVLGYTREHFGGWADHWYEHAAGAGMCSTRGIVLLETFGGTASPTAEATTEQVGSCPTATGTATDLYSGQPLTPQDVEVDHVVPLAVAWDHGAHAWPRHHRVDFANDRELNLLAVSGEQNRHKSDGSLSEWSPPHAGTACAYAARYLSVAVRYSLSITKDDKEAAGSACGL
ncbi:MAG TPA: HNH endonuclease family protein [Candidatus Corynebacterium avicola]|uniref:HNH endonuclease family protein n=1 Tax=Candidatus Corynebacterium avicola TaxID=2838527 RepID=A0A9D1RKQ3_9CORY|nr:HNH endonuclease family protein [Candidatus Corynebacterium avicola]